MSDKDKMIKKILEMQTKLFIPIHVDSDKRFKDWEMHELNLYYKATERLYYENGQDRTN